MRIQRPKPTHAMYSLLSMNLLSCVWFNGNCFSGVKSFQGKLFSRKGKCIQVVWLSRKSFYEKSIPMFGSFKHFTENGSRFTKNQFSCLVHSNILQKIKFVLRKINSHVWFVDHFTENTKCLTNSELANSEPVLSRQTYNSTKIIIHFNIEIIIHFNIKINHPNIAIIFISKQPHQSFTIGITPPWCTKMIPTRDI